MRRAGALVAAITFVLTMLGGVTSPANACMGELCDAVNFVCSKTITKGHDCVK